MFSEWKVQRKEARKLEDIARHELDAVLCRFLAEMRKRSRIRNRKFGCLAVLVGPLLKKLRQKLQYFARSSMCNNLSNNRATESEKMCLVL